MKKFIIISTFLLIYSLSGQEQKSTKTEEIESIKNVLSPLEEEKRAESPELKNRSSSASPIQPNQMTILDDHEEFQQTEELMRKEQQSSQFKRLVHEKSLEEITGESPEIKELLCSQSEETINLQNILTMHEKLTQLCEQHQKPSFAEQLITYGIATGIATASYYFFTSPQTKKVRASLPITPFIVIGTSIGALMYLRHWFNEDKFKALDHIKEASHLAIKTAQELKIIKTELSNFARTNRELIQKLEPFTKTTERILADIGKISKTSNSESKLAEIQQYTLELVVYNAQQYNKLVQKIIPESEQKDFLITELETISFTDYKKNPKQSSPNFAHQSSPSNDDDDIIAEASSSKELTTIFTPDQLTQQKRVIDEYCEKHPVLAFYNGVQKIGYYAIPLKWRQKHYKEFDDSITPHDKQDYTITKEELHEVQ